MSSQLVRDVKNQLRVALVRCRPNVKFRTDYYVDDLSDIFVPGVKLGAFRGNFSTSDLKRMSAVHSSNTLVFNSFAAWATTDRLKDLVIGRFQDFRWMLFECLCPHGLGTTAPHLDVVLEFRNEAGKVGILGIESKFTEHFGNQWKQIEDAYNRIACFAELRKIFENPKSLGGRFEKWKYLGVKQLIAHIVGLEYSSRDKYDEVALLYLYWQPLETANAKMERWRAAHLQELRCFEELYRQTCWASRVKFYSLSYLDLWSQWQNTSSAWVQRHTRNLQARYQFTVP